MYKYFKMAGNEMSSWESKGLSDEEIKLLQFQVLVLPPN